LPLLVLWVIANDAHNALAVNYFALIADLFYWRTHFHDASPCYLYRTKYPRRKSLKHDDRALKSFLFRHE